MSTADIMNDEELVEFNKSLAVYDQFDSKLKGNAEYTKMLKLVMDSKIHNAIKEFCDKTSFIPTINISFNTTYVEDQKEPLLVGIDVDSTINLPND